ncbi:hypothetical protein ACFL1I_05835, partial [Candidatus Omnitrophota bacterium]
MVKIPRITLGCICMVLCFTLIGFANQKEGAVNFDSDPDIEKNEVLNKGKFITGISVNRLIAIPIADYGLLLTRRSAKSGAQMVAVKAEDPDEEYISIALGDRFGGWLSSGLEFQLIRDGVRAGAGRIGVFSNSEEASYIYDNYV